MDFTLKKPNIFLTGLLILLFYFPVFAREKSSVKIKEIKREKKVSIDEAQMLSSREIMIENPLEEKLVDEIDGALVQLTKMSKKLLKGSLARAKIFHKIIELSLEQAGYITSQEHRIFDEIWSKWYEGGKVGKEPLFSSKDSKKYYKLVIRFADLFLEEYPKHEGRTLVLFQKAVSLQYLDKYINAINTFQNIIDESPDSEIASEAFFEVGSHYFDRDKFALAQDYLSEVLKFKTASRKDWALYKIGWIHFNLGRYEQCLKLWKKTVEITLKKEEESGFDNLLKKQVLKDMIYVFAELGTINDAVKYFSKYGDDDNVSRFLFYLGQAYFEQGKRSKAKKTYLALLKKLPNSLEAVKVQFELALIAYEAREFDELWERLEAWQIGYHEDSEWAQNQREDHIEENLLRLEETILYYAQKMQIEAEKRRIKIGKRYRSPTYLYTHAKKGYHYYLKMYPDSPRVPEVLEYLGDVNYSLKDYKASVEAYTEIVLMPVEEAVLIGAEGKEENIHARVAHNMLDSASLHFAPYYEKLLKKKPDFETKKPEPLSEAAKLFIKSCKLFEKFYKEGDLKKKCDLFSSTIYYQTGDKKRAKKSLKYIALQYRADPEGALGLGKFVNLYKESPEIQVKIAKQFLKIKSYSTSEIGSKLRLLIRTYELEKISKESSPEERGELYEQFALDHPKDEEIEALWYKAALAYLAGGSLVNTVRIFKLLFENYPQFEKREQILLQLAQIYESLFKFKKAIDSYFLYSRLYPKGRQALAAKERSCTLSFVVQDKGFISFCTEFASHAGEKAKGSIRGLLESSYYAKNIELYTQLLYGIYFKLFSLSSSEKILALYRLYKLYPKNNSSAVSVLQKIKGFPLSKDLTGESLRLYADFYFEDFKKSLEKIQFSQESPKTIPELQTQIQNNLALLKQGESLASSVLSLKEAYSTAKVFYELSLHYAKMLPLLSRQFSITGVTQEQINHDLSPVINSVDTQRKSYLKSSSDIVTKFKLMGKIVLSLKKTKDIEASKKYSETWVPDFKFTSFELEKEISREFLVRSK